MTTTSTKAELGPSLNDVDLCKYTLTITLEARKLAEHSANRRALALAESLTKIEDAARQAQWRLLKLADEQGVEV
jgi:hypothetical protein